MSSIANEPVEYIALLTVNGSPQPSFTTVLLPGDITVRQEFIWPVLFRGNVSARFRLIAVGKVSKEGFELADISKEYMGIRSSCGGS